MAKSGDPHNVECFLEFLRAKQHYKLFLRFIQSMESIYRGFNPFAALKSQI